jgi:hypothetical protein
MSHHHPHCECRSLLHHKEKYLINFANSVYDEFRKMKYGIESCRKTGKLYIDEMRHDLIQYHMNDDGDALCEVSIRHMGWLPVYYPTPDESCDYQTPWCDNDYKIQKCNKGPQGIGMSYVGNGGSANIIEVNSGGCITRINVNPTIIINNNTGASFTYAQNCAQPATVWNIVHNLGYTPNVWVEDCDGCNADGVIAVVNPNTITITFSSPIGGIAHLS